jgi:hypothetical protein
MKIKIILKKKNIFIKYGQALKFIPNAGAEHTTQ